MNFITLSTSVTYPELYGYYTVCVSFMVLQYSHFPVRLCMVIGRRRLSVLFGLVLLQNAMSRYANATEKKNENCWWSEWSVLSELGADASEALPSYIEQHIHCECGS